MCGVATTCGRPDERLVGRRLDHEHVEARTGDMAPLDGIGERRLVDQLTARSVDDAHAGLAGGEPRRIEQVPGLGGRGNVQRDVVGAAAQVVERHELGAHRRRDLLGDERVVRQHVHSECARAVGDFLADSAEPDDAERLAAHFGAGETLLVPHASLHGRIGGADRARQREHQCPGVFGHADAVRAGCIHDDDAAIRGGGDVDVVHAGAGTGDYPKPWGGSDELRIDLGRAANDQRVSVGEVLGQFRGRPPGPRVNGETRNGSEDFNGR